MGKVYIVCLFGICILSCIDTVFFTRRLIIVYQKWLS
jgi:hypothetical protein